MEHLNIRNDFLWRMWCNIKNLKYIKDAHDVGTHVILKNYLSFLKFTLITIIVQIFMSWLFMSVEMTKKSAKRGEIKNVFYDPP